MSSSTHDDLGDKILADLGRLTRDKRARDEAQTAEYEPLPAQRRAVIIAQLIGPESDDGNDDDAPAPGHEVDPSHADASEVGDPSVTDDPSVRKAAAALTDDPDAQADVVPLVAIGPEAAANDRRWLVHVGGYLATAAAAAAVVAIVLPSEPGRDEPKDSPRAAAVDKPAFESWRIDGGGPPPEHLGEPKGQLVCPNNPLTLTLAMAPGQSLDPSLPLQLVVQATPFEGPGHRFVIDLDDDQRFEWAGKGRALVYRGTLQQLVPLTPGQWVLEPSVGTPGACTDDQRQACTPLDARTIEIGERDRCDGKNR